MHFMFRTVVRLHPARIPFPLWTQNYFCLLPGYLSVGLTYSQEGNFKDLATVDMS